MTENQSRVSVYLLSAGLGVFLIGRLFGADLFDNNWSFVHWRLQPLWYPIVWAVLAGSVGLVLYRYSEKIGNYFSSPAKVALGMGVVLTLLILFGFDSVVAGYGNRRMGQIVQADRIIYRWFEMGSVGLVACFYRFCQNIFSSDYTAGLIAWKLFSYGCTIVTMLGSVIMAGRLTVDKARRVLYFIILFFGSQTPVYFGFVGVETVVPAFSIWFALFAMSAVQDRSFTNLIAVWVTVAIGVAMHASLAFLIPAALFVTIVTLFKKINLVLPIGLALSGYAVLIWLAYQWAGSSLEYQTMFLFVEGKLPHADYGLFDSRRIGDLVQLLFLAAPLVVTVKCSLLGQIKKIFPNRSILMVWLMALGGLTWIFISDPRQSIVLELPRLVAYFAPFSIFIVLAARKARETIGGLKLYLSIIATAAIFIPMTFLPSYTSIAGSELIVDNYMEEQDAYYHDACVAYRDAYFVRGEYTEADRWERLMVVKSDEYLNIRGSADLAHQEQFSDAIRVLHQMIVANPYWAEPRVQLASIQMKVGRYQMAKPHIDTCLMLEPYNKNHHIHRYVYYRSIRNLPAALNAIERALELFPSDLDIQSDEMLLHYGMGHHQIADSLATELYHSSDTLPFPYYVRGMMAAKTNDRSRAIVNFEKFIELAPDEVETPMIQLRVDSLKAIGTGE